MLKRLFIILILNSLLPGLPVAAKTIFRQVTTQDGLNDGTINSITEDSDGIIWIATWDGLMKYDGLRIKNYKPILGDIFSLPSKRINYLFVDAEGNLWIHTTSGICRYDKARDRFISYLTEEPYRDGGANRTIFESNDRILINAGGRLYALLKEQVLQERMFRQIEIKSDKNTIPPGDFILMYPEQERLVLIRPDTESGAGGPYLVISAEAVTDGDFYYRINEEFSVPEVVLSYCSDQANRSYIGTTDGLYIFYRLEKRLIKLEETRGQRINKLFISSDKRLWMGTNLSGLGALDLHSFDYNRYTHDPDKNWSLAGSGIYSLYEDFSGNLWIGHDGEGISILNLNQKAFESFSYETDDIQSLSDNTIFCFNETEREILIGTKDGGLNSMQYDPVERRITFRKLPIPEIFMVGARYPSIWHITRESENLFWLGTNYGLIKAVRDQDQWQFEKSKFSGTNSTIRRVFLDDNRNMWLGTYNGLMLIPSAGRSDQQIFHYTHQEEIPGSLSDNIITSILIDSKDNFWIGTRNAGINRLTGNYHDLDLSGNLRPDLQFLQLIAGNAPGKYLNNSEINCLYEHSDGRIWAGTQGGGINCIDPESSVVSYITPDDGLPGDDVFGIIPDENGRLWISTNKGIACLDPDSMYFTNYSPADGIQGNVFMVNSWYKSRDGQIYFGGRNGFTRFNPENIGINTIQPRIHLSGVQIFNKDISIGDTVNNRIILSEALSNLKSLTFSHREYDFSILFSVCHYQQPEDNRVEYLLEGFDRQWNQVPATAGMVSFANLPHGSYTLKIRAANSDNIWTDGYKELQINILPPWWRTLQAQLLFGFLTILAVMGLLTLVLHRQRLQHSLRIEKMEKERLEEINESKLRFFTNISHDLRTPLSLTVASIEDLIRNPDSTKNYVQKQLRLANRNAKTLIRLINQIIDFRRLNAGKLKLSAVETDLKGFIYNVIQNFEGLQSEKGIDLITEFPESPFPLWFDPQKMEEILFNLLSNAFNHTLPGGTIRISFSRSVSCGGGAVNDEGWARISVFNDGKEIPQDKLDLIFERFYKLNEDSQGSGIGLALCKSLVELHQGEIEVSSGLNQGTTFTIYLPLGDSHFSDDEKDIKAYFSFIREPEMEFKSEEIPEAGSHGESGLSLLVVEDNLELRGFFRSILSKDYRFFEAENGRAGLKIAEEIIPDIIVSDVMMPEMNGFEMCEKIKSNTKTSHIPIILLTAKDTEEHKISGYASGADAYVLKPFEIRVLEIQIKQLIKNRDRIRKNYQSKHFVVGSSGENESMEDQFISKIRRMIENNIQNNDFNVNTLANDMNISPTHLYRKVKALTGYSSVEFIRIIRLLNAAEFLKSNQYSVKEVCYLTGFYNPSYFIKCFREYFKTTPAEYISYINAPDES